jgi:hypothetical protein
MNMRGNCHHLWWIWNDIFEEMERVIITFLIETGNPSEKVCYLLRSTVKMVIGDKSVNIAVCYGERKGG